MAAPFYLLPPVLALLALTRKKTRVDLPPIRGLEKRQSEFSGSVERISARDLDRDVELSIVASCLGAETTFLDSKVESRDQTSFEKLPQALAFSLRPSNMAGGFGGKGGPPMLVLSRGLNDKVVFPTLGITVEILRLVGSKVRLGIDAPREIPVVREEIADRPARSLLAAPTPDEIAKARLAHGTRNRLHKATLGLRLVQRMLEAGQANDIEPTIFKIFNELKTLEDELAGPSAPPSPEGQPIPQGKHCRALIVEDDANECQLLASYLRLTGFDVDTAADGLHAMVQLAKRDRPDIVLLDMKMPRFDGTKTVSAIRENPDYRALKIFAVTGTDQSETSVNIGPNGVDRWFRKPVDPEQLVSAIHSELNAELATA